MNSKSVFQKYYPLIKGEHKYFSENFQEYSSAASKLQMIKSIGFSDAFIISTLNGKEISLEKALELD